MSKKNKENLGHKIVALNKKARRDYEILDKFEAGIVLKGSEVKSIRAGSANLKESYIRIISGEAFLVGCHVTPYSHARSEEISPKRDRKLLLHRREIDRLDGQVTLKGLSLVPLALYFKDSKCKVEFGLGRGKKLYDKREDVKKKEANRELERAIKSKI